MSGNINPGPVGQQTPIHHATVFGPAGYHAATTCGRTEQPKPASAEWRYVTCPKCLARRLCAQCGFGHDVHGDVAKTRCDGFKEIVERKDRP